MEEKFVIRRARLEFGDYIKLVAIFGLCAGVLTAGINIVVDVYELIFGDAGHGFTHFLFSVLMSLASAVLAPVAMGLYGVLLFPIYRYITNRWFSMSLSIHGELEHE